jgi:hypothetical protein
MLIHLTSNGITFLGQMAQVAAARWLNPKKLIASGHQGSRSAGGGTGDTPDTCLAVIERRRLHSPPAQCWLTPFTIGTIREYRAGRRLTIPALLVLSVRRRSTRPATSRRLLYAAAKGEIEGLDPLHI